MKKLNIIGCGRIGKTLGRLWHERGCFKIQDVLNRSLTSASQAVSFIGEGRAISAYSAMQEADPHPRVSRPCG
jgi:predicted dinucleotide-binding enzyme